MIKVLITSAGSAAGMNCISALTNQSDLDLEIVAVDAHPFAAGVLKSKIKYTVPPIKSHNAYIDRVLQICVDENVQIILPTFSEEIPLFAYNLKIFRKNSIKFLIPPYDSVRIFEDKWLSYKYFCSERVDTPKTWQVRALPKKVPFPVIVKPIKGSGSRNTFIANSQDELNFYIKFKENEIIIQEIINGREFTIDILADKNYKIVAAVPRERILKKGGMAIVSKTASPKYIPSEIETIISSMNLIGPINIQYIFSGEKHFFIDVNTRFAAGGLPLTVKSGQNIPLMVIKLILGQKVSKIQKYKNNLVMVRYYQEVFANELENGTYKIIS